MAMEAGLSSIYFKKSYKHYTVYDCSFDKQITNCLNIFLIKKINNTFTN